MSPYEVPTSRRSRLIARVRPAVVRSAGGGPAPLVEVAGLLLVVLLFSQLHAAMGKDAAAATAHALTLQSVERTLHLDVELGANQWLTSHPALIPAAVSYYRLYYAAIIGVLAWTYVRHADIYVKARRTLITMLVLVLPVFWWLPMSPPRFALPGIVDIVARHDLLGDHTSGNLYSAMPSMHVGWSLWCAYAAWCALRPTHPRTAFLPWLFPLGMTAVVLTTGNHYVLDVAGSITLLALSIAIVSAWSRLTHRTPSPNGN